MESHRVGDREPLRGKAIVLKELSYQIVGAFFDVYNELGYGFLENVYSAALSVAFDRAGLRVEREKSVPVVYRGVEVGYYRIDMLVEQSIIVELKSIERLTDIPKRQIRNYLSAAGLELGLLLHFGPTAQFYRILRPPEGRIIARLPKAADSDEFG